METLSLTPEQAASLKQCKVGENETVSVTGKVTKNDDTGFEMEIDSATSEYDEEKAETQKETSEGEGDGSGDGEEKPAKSKSMKMILGE